MRGTLKLIVIPDPGVFSRGLSVFFLIRKIRMSNRFIFFVQQQDRIGIFVAAKQCNFGFLDLRDRLRSLPGGIYLPNAGRSEEHPSELQSLMSISYDVFCLKKKNTTQKK